jgi:hypothetical protein
MPRLRIMGYLISLMLLAPATCVLGNPVINPGIEVLVDGDPYGWSRYNAPGTSYGPASDISPNARTGKAALLIDLNVTKIHLPAGQRARQSWMQAFDLDTAGTEPGQTHTLSFYYRTEGAAELHLKIERYHREKRSDHSSAVFRPAPEWTYVEHDFVWPDLQTYHRNVNLHFFAVSKNGGRLLIDDIALTHGASAEREPGVFYVSPTGNDDSSGSKDRPWASLRKVSMEARAGDTFIFLPGEYPGTLQPQESGTMEAPIIFRTAERRTALLGGPWGADYAIKLEDVEHIRLEGFHVCPASDQGRWLLARNTRHIHLTDMLMEKGTGGMPFGSKPILWCRPGSTTMSLITIMRKGCGCSLARGPPP